MHCDICPDYNRGYCICTKTGKEQWVYHECDVKR